MKSIAYIVALIFICILSFFLLKPDPNKIVIPDNLPWHIKHINNTTKVFDIELERTTLAQVIALLGLDHELAIIVDKDDDAALEMYFSHFKSGPLKGKLIVGFDVNLDELMAMQEQAANQKYMASGSRQFFLSKTDLQTVQTKVVSSLSYIPSVNLSEEVVIQRFGEPAEIIIETATTQHLLYPKLGLDISLNEEAKEQFQYVSPTSFYKLIKPLRQLQNDQPLWLINSI